MAEWPLLSAIFILIFAVVAFFLAALVIKFVVEVRDEFRDHYLDEGWKPVGPDFFLVPIWLLLEMLCFLGILLDALFTLFLAYQVATTARDWWHAGNKPRR